jgi:hypothetical protein
LALSSPLGEARAWAALAMLALVLTTTAPRSSFAAAPPASFDKTLFLSTVPSYATVGDNYTVKVLVSNNLDVPVPVLVRVNAPVASIYVWPLLQRGSVPPSGTKMFNFTLIAFSDNSGQPINVTALLWVWFVKNTSSPQLVQSSSKFINGVSQPVGVLLVSVVGVSLVVAAVVAVFWWRRQRGPPVPA